MSPRDELRAWVRENPRAPAWWRALALRIADYDADAELWASLPARLRREPLFAFSLARNALAVADAEMARPREASEEDAALQRVADALRELERAIAAAPLEPGRGWLRELRAQGLPPIVLRFGWRGLADDEDANALGHPVSVVDVARAARELLEDERAQRAGRWVKRRRELPRATAFVRHLHAASERALGEALTADALAHLANAAMDDPDALLGGADVRRMLRGLKRAKSSG